MKQKFYVRPISVVLSTSMFDQLKAITDEMNIAISDFIRNAIKRKLDELSNFKKTAAGESDFDRIYTRTLKNTKNSIFKKISDASTTSTSQVF